MIFQMDIEAILVLLKHDKKNIHCKVMFVLLHEIGKPVIDKEIHSDLLLEAFHFYQKD